MRPKKKVTTAPRGPQKIGDVVSQLMAQTGFARVKGNEAVADAWRETVGEAAAPYTRPGKIRRGVLEIGVANSTIMQELVFQKTELLSGLRRLLPDSRIQDLRFQIVTIEGR